MTRTLHLVAAAALLAGCSGGGGDDDQTYRCDTETRAVVYAPGMVATGNDAVYEIELVEATPAPPDKGDNSWLIEVRDATTTTPTSAVDLVVTPFMPDHGHGSPITPVVTPGAGDGRFQIDSLNLWMPGLWEVRIDVTDGDTATDLVVFPFCVEG